MSTISARTATCIPASTSSNFLVLTLIVRFSLSSLMLAIGVCCVSWIEFGHGRDTHRPHGPKDRRDRRARTIYPPPCQARQEIPPGLVYVDRLNDPDSDSSEVMVSPAAGCGRYAQQALQTGPSGVS